MSIKSGLWFPLFDELADPRVAVWLAVEAEEAGWDGVFFWDHINWDDSVTRLADPWIVMSAAAQVTERVKLGPMVTSLPRRRPAKVARETASLDVLSDGRLILGVGLGSDRFGREYSATGDETDDRLRGEMLDESIAILQAAWTGERVEHHGAHYTIDGLTFLPTPSHPVAIWSAGFAGKRKPMERAARLDGFVPVNIDSADQVAEIWATLAELRADDTAPFDLAVEIEAKADVAAYAAAGATWWLTGFSGATVTEDEVRGVLRDGPADGGASGA
jgi:alkanesulfonate monooxygenase SsuD/methylene tetrahydromethanopterin reductase-like flavin-dependent oxidoreductase (luciferase family)